MLLSILSLLKMVLLEMELMMLLLWLLLMMLKKKEQKKQELQRVLILLCGIVFSKKTEVLKIEIEIKERG